MTGTVAEFLEALDADALAAEIAVKWQGGVNNRNPWATRVKELRDYVFATDTRTTSNKKNGWKNSTTLPKLCQIRDNLHANYMAALFPNENWLKWEAYTQEDAAIQKSETIEAYMSNKTRKFNFVETVSRLVYDYIDYGNFFMDVEYTVRYRTNEAGDREVVDQGPVLIRRSPFDVVFNLAAPTFDQSYHIVRTIKTMGELEREIRQNPEAGYLAEALAKQVAFRARAASFTSDEANKLSGIQVDGFGSYSEYLQSDYVELLEFRGNIRDANNNEYLENKIITVMDRSTVVRNVPMPSWLGESTLTHGGWRLRPDNLMAMGPLDNLVGMQYRIDHLENIKADMWDLTVQPPIVMKGQIEEFDWEPLAEIFLGDDGEIDVLKIDSTALGVDSQIAILEQKMDEFAGAPKQAIGARTPGEKTAFEVQTLENNANKMFQEKTISFEMKLERALNIMLEVSKRNLEGVDIIGVMDTDFGVQRFLELSKADIVSQGKIVPVGARHFAARAQNVQNYQGLRNMVGIDPGVMNHISGIKEAEMLEDLLGFEKYELVRQNVRLEEAAESQRLTQSLQGQLEEEALTPADEEEEAALQQVIGEQGGEEGAVQE